MQQPVFWTRLKDTVHDAFKKPSKGWNQMLKDKDIREPLFDFLEDTYGKVRIIEEKTMGKSRADVVMVTETALVGIEIKSDADSYERLARQIKDYDSYFDYNIIAVGTKHALSIKDHVPEWWGIITIEEADKEVDLYYYRKPLLSCRGKAEAKLKRQLAFLWRPELAHVQEINKMPRYKTSSKKFVAEKILEKVEPELLKRQICGELFERDYTRIAQQIQEFKEANNRPVKKPGRRRRRYSKSIK